MNLKDITKYVNAVISLTEDPVLLMEKLDVLDIIYGLERTVYIDFEQLEISDNQRNIFQSYNIEDRLINSKSPHVKPEWFHDLIKKNNLITSENTHLLELNSFFWIFIWEKSLVMSHFDLLGFIKNGINIIEKMFSLYSMFGDINYCDALELEAAKKLIEDKIQSTEEPYVLYLLEQFLLEVKGFKVKST